MWNIIPNSIKQISDTFTKNGKSLYVVGGAVRDFILNDTPKDFDLCTDALPDEMISILSDYKLNLMSKSFGVIIVYTDDQKDGIEITTFRKDISKGRNPIVELGATIEDDVKRRDLTYNAMFYDIQKKEVIDTVGGIDDLKNGITRMVGNANLRIEEDTLRILRINRFSSRYSHTLHDDIKVAIKNNNKLLNINPENGEIERVSQERIWNEFKSAFKQSKSFASYLEFYNEFSMWNEIFPNSVINSSIVESKYIEVYLANLFKYEDIDTLFNKMIFDFKIDSVIAKKVIFLLNLSKLNDDNVLDLIKERNKVHIDDDMILDFINVFVKRIDDIFLKFISFKLTVSSQDLIEKGFSGKELGIEIKRQELNNFKSFNIL